MAAHLQKWYDCLLTAHLTENTRETLLALTEEAIYQVLASPPIHTGAARAFVYLDFTMFANKSWMTEAVIPIHLILL